MIPIKELLFKILDTIEVYECVRISILNNDLYISRKDAHFPLALRFIHWEPEMDANYFYNEDSEYVEQYLKTHKVTVNNTDYVIEQELLDVKYYDDYIYMATRSIAGTCENYISYDSIDVISKINVKSPIFQCSSEVIKEYNKSQAKAYLNDIERLNFKYLN